MSHLVVSDEEVALQTVIERYEILRTATVGEGLSLETRGGLAVFLRRGMWSWIQASHPTTPVHSLDPRSAQPVAGEHQTIIQLFAALVTSFIQRKTHECFHESSIASS